MPTPPDPPAPTRIAVLYRLRDASGQLWTGPNFADLARAVRARNQGLNLCQSCPFVIPPEAP